MRRPHGGHVMGASPQIPFADDLSARQGDLICPQDQLLDLRMIQSWYQSGALKGGLWLPDWAYQEQSAGTAVTAAGQVVGVWAPAASTYSASQTTTANKPLTALTPITRKPWLTADSTDVMPVTFPTALGSACTIARATPTGVTFDEAQTISTTWNGLIRPYQYNSAVLVADRALTAREKAVVSRVLGAYVPALGNELASNGQFDTDLAGWTLYNTDANNTVTYESGRVHAISDGSKALGFGQATAKIGNIYYVTFSYEHVSGSGFRFENPDTTPPFIGTSSKDVILCIVANNVNFRIYRVASGLASNGYFDDMSFRQVF